VADADAEVVVGVVGKPLGLVGEVYVQPDADLPVDVYEVGRSLRVRPPEPGSVADRPTDEAADTDAATGARPLSLQIATTRLHAGRRVVRFVGVDTREDAEALRHLELTVPRGQISLEEDAFWAEDLLGREVVDHTGAVIGVLEAVADGTAHDYLVVARPDGGELLIPAVAELVTISGEALVVNAIPGLLDLEE